MQNELADTIVQDIVAEEQQNSQEVTVDQFTGNVEAKAEERVEELREVFGSQIDVVAGQGIENAQWYRGGPPEGFVGRGPLRDDIHLPAIFERCRETR